jgi:hypothetical protein
MTLIRSTMMSAVFAAAGLALLLGPIPAHAQDVPAVSGDITTGSGNNSAHAGELWFLKTNTSSLSADLAVRLGGAGSTRPVLLLGYSADMGPQYVNAICLLAPNGSCKGTFPGAVGPSIGLGLRQTLGRWVLVGVGGGIASYGGNARFAEADASVRIFSHFAIVGEFRYIDLPVEGSRAWFTPLTFGARLFW